MTIYQPGILAPRTLLTTYRLVVGQLIHCLLSHVQALGDVIDGKDEYFFTGRGVLDAVALPTRGRVPTSNVGAASNVRETRDIALL
jgi:hypothetical protein